MKTAAICMAAAAFMAMPALAEPQTDQGELILYEGADYQGARIALDVSERRVRTDWAVHSLSVHPGERWLVCERSRYRGACVVLDRSVQDIASLGDAGRLGSARPWSEPRAVAAAVPSLIPSQPHRQPGT